MDLIMALTTVAVSVACGIIAAYWVFDLEMNKMDSRLRELEKRDYDQSFDDGIYNIERGEDWGSK
jgi:hypothetical protein